MLFRFVLPVDISALLRFPLAFLFAGILHRTENDFSKLEGSSSVFLCLNTARKEEECYPKGKHLITIDIKEGEKS